MSASRSRRKKRRARALQIPRWYYIMLAAIAVVGVALLVVSGLLRTNTTGVTTEGDYYMGRAEAPVTIIDWGNFN